MNEIFLVLQYNAMMMTIDVCDDISNPALLQCIT